MAEPKRVLVVHLYKPKAFAEILARLKAGKRPPETEIFLGSYGIRPAHAKAIAAIPGAHYAPTFHLGPAVNVDIRSGRHDLPNGTPPFDTKFAGVFPADPNVPWLPREKPRAWGVEIGRRFRDKLRAAHKRQPLIVNWQLDEIPRECGIHPTRRADFRLFVGGVVRGIAEGRPRLKDKPLPGFVWIGAEALTTLPGASLTADMKIFWDDVNAGTRFLVGEEYPTFVIGGAPAAAKVLARPQRALAARGSESRQALAKKYVVGMTPGWHRPEGQWSERQSRRSETARRCPLAQGVHRCPHQGTTTMRLRHVPLRRGFQHRSGAYRRGDRRARLRRKATRGTLSGLRFDLDLFVERRVATGNR